MYAKRDASSEAICEPNTDHVTNLADATGYTESSVVAARMGRGGPAVTFHVHGDAFNFFDAFDDNAAEYDTYHTFVEVGHHDVF